ncbi:MAG: TIR domain-containing protein [Xanthobacteraceae bacterium]
MGRDVAFDVFISYSSHDKPVAAAACSALEAAEIRCWIAPRDVSLGDNYGAAIVEAIESAKIFVLIFSGNANTSPQISREVERAVSKGLTIIPVRIEDVAPSRNLEYFISSPHWLDAFPPPRDKYFAKLVEAVRTLLGQRTETPPSTTVPVPSTSKPTSRRALLAAVAVMALLLVVAGGYVLYQSQNQGPLRTLAAHTDFADSISFAPHNNFIAAGGYDSAIYAWSTQGGDKPVLRIGNFYGHGATYSPDGKWIGGGADDKSVRIWDAISGRVLHTYVGHSNFAQTEAFSPDQKMLASGSLDTTVYVWDTSSDQPIKHLTGAHNNTVYSVAFSPDNKLLVSAGFDRKIIIWDVATWTNRVVTNNANVNAALFSPPDGRWIASGDWDGYIKIWEVDTGLLQLSFTNGSGNVTSLAYSPDGKRLVTGDASGIVSVWDATTGGRPLKSLVATTGKVWGVGWAPNGKWIASAGEDKLVKIWKAP